MNIVKKDIKKARRQCPAGVPKMKVAAKRRYRRYTHQLLVELVEEVNSAEEVVEVPNFDPKPEHMLTAWDIS